MVLARVAATSALPEAISDGAPGDGVRLVGGVSYTLSGPRQ
jgi:hypothetical protein